MEIYMTLVWSVFVAVFFVLYAIVAAFPFILAWLWWQEKVRRKSVIQAFLQSYEQGTYTTKTAGFTMFGAYPTLMIEFPYEQAGRYIEILQDGSVSNQKILWADHRNSTGLVLTDREQKLIEPAIAEIATMARLEGKFDNAPPFLMVTK